MKAFFNFANAGFVNILSFLWPRAGWWSCKFIMHGLHVQFFFLWQAVGLIVLIGNNERLRAAIFAAFQSVRVRHRVEAVRGGAIGDRLVGLPKAFEE